MRKTYARTHQNKNYEFTYKFDFERRHNFIHNFSINKLDIFKFLLLIFYF